MNSALNETATPASRPSSPANSTHSSPSGPTASEAAHSLSSAPEATTESADSPLRSLLRKRWIHNWATILAFASLSATVFRPQWSFGHEAMDHALDAVGLGLVFLGIFIRLCARGRKYDTPGRGITMDGV